MTRSTALACAALLAACGGTWEPGFTLHASSGSTSETGGTATIAVSLTRAPTATVQVDVVSSDATEGALLGAEAQPVAWSTLTFTPSDWHVARTVTVRGLDDDARDGDVSWAVVFSVSATEDPGYASAGAARVTFSNRDDDTPGIVVTRQSLVTWEQGQTTDGFAVVLASRPSGTVAVPVVTARPEEVLLRSDSSPTVSQAQLSLVFTPSSWAMPQAVTAVGQDDGWADGDQTLSLTVGPATGDAEYAALPPQAVSVTNRDAAGRFLVTPASLRLFEGDVGELCVELPAAPTAEVRLPVTSGDPGEGLVSVAGSDGPFAAAAALVVAAGTMRGCFWLMASLDDVDDGDRSFSVTVGPTVSADGALDSQPARRIDATSVDVDVAWVWVDPPPWLWLSTSEAGQIATLRIGLQTRPAFDVTVPIQVDSPEEALLSVSGGPPSPSLVLRFSPEEWDVPQEVTVTGVDDALLELGPPHPFLVSFSPVQSLDPCYGGLFLPAVGGANADDEIAMDEGSAAAPFDVTGALPWDGMVGAGTSHYAVTGLPGGALVTLTSGTSDLPVTVDDDGDPANGILCAFTAGAGGRGACLARAPAGGALVVRVDGSGSALGAAFALDVAPYFVSSDVPKAVPDLSSLGVGSSLSLTGAPASVAGVTVVLHATHAFAYDLEGTLVSPSGSRVQLFWNTFAATYSGGYPLTVFDDAAPTSITAASMVNGAFRPLGWLGSLAGEDANGTWRLELVDRINYGYSGQLLGWGLSVR